MFQPEIEALSRDALARLQLARLRATLGHAFANVALTREKFAAAGVEPGDLAGLADLRRFPFTVKDDLRAAYPYGMMAVARADLARLHMSSGTTGKPTITGYTTRDLGHWSDIMARAMAGAGARPGDVIQNAHGYGLFTGGLGVHQGAERLGCTVVPASGGNTERQVILLRDLGADVLIGTPSYVLHIAEVAERMGVDLRAARLRIGLCGAEPWGEGMRREIESRLGIRATDLYGLSEIMGPGVASECAEGRDGLHGWEDHFLFEIIDPETGAPVPDGTDGELVVTTLTREAMPMIRYRTRDITRMIPGDCPCGRTHRRLARITGRNDSMLIIRGINIFPSQIEALLATFPNIAPHYQLVARRDGTMDTLTVEIETKDGCDKAACAGLGTQLRDHIKSRLGLKTEIAVVAAGSLPRFEGKASRVKDLRSGGSA